MTLQQEFDTYRTELPQLLPEKEGQYVVIRGQQLCDYFDSYESALAWAYDKFGLDPFFVKRIEPIESASHFLHDLRPCQE